MAAILEGVRVLDLTRNVAGPFCTMTLADLGADVIKVERPGGGDDTREWRPPEWEGYSTTFLAFNRNKRSLAVDLDQPEGCDLVRQLAERADVLVESFRNGSLAKRGLGYGHLRERNPRLIYCSISGFGARGPHEARPGYDPVIQAYSGIMSITGEAGGEAVRTGPAVVDMGAGLWAALGVLAALLQRERTGRGQLVETSLLETALGWLAYHVAGYLGTGVAPRRSGSQGLVAAPYETLQTADEPLFLAAPNDQLFARLCAVLGAPALAEEARFRSNPLRLAHRPALREALEAALRTAPAAEWERRLLAADIPCSRIRAIDQVLEDPQVAALDMLMPLVHPGIPHLRQIDLPVAVDGQRAVRRDAPPELGQHTDDILKELGCDEATLERWRRDGVIASFAPLSTPSRS